MQLQDSDGKPTRATENTTITLSSSRTDIGIIQPKITISEGETYAPANFTATFLPGSTTISASVNGFETVQTTMATIGPVPYSVAVFGLPSTLPADGLPYEAIMVQVQDVEGNPARAPKGGVLVTLSCSNTTVGMVSSSVIIPEGQSFAMANFTALNSGDAVVTSVAQGYDSQQVTITTTQVQTQANCLAIYAGSATVPADATSYAFIAVELQQVEGSNTYASKLSSPVEITLSSNNLPIGQIPSTITIPPDQSYVVTTLNTTYTPGTAIITAVATNLPMVQQVMTTTGFTPSKLAVYLAPSTLPSDTETYNTVQVQLQDDQGNPAKDPDSNVTIDMFSSKPTVASVSSQLVIPFGQTQTNGTIQVTNTPGTTAIIAQASSYLTGQKVLTTYLVDMLPLQITASAASSSITNGQTTDVTVSVTSENVAVLGATIQFTSDNGGSFSSTAELGSGNYRTTFTAPSFTQATTCTITATAQKASCISSSATTQVTVQPPPTASPSPSPSPSPTATQSATSNSSPDSTPTPTPTPATTQTTTTAKASTLTLQIKDASGNPLSDSTVSSTNQPTGQRYLFGISNESGYVTFRNVTAGQYTFNVEKEGYGQTDKAITFSGQPASVEVAFSSGEASMDLTTIIVIVVVVIVVIVLGILLVKRRRSKATELPPLSSFKY